jgi:hypothetical protein
MLTRAYPLIFRNRKRPARRPPPGTPPAPAALVLVSATYEEVVSVSLTFDRAIDIDALVGAQITVDDGAVAGILYAATGVATLTDPQTVRIELSEIGLSTGPGTTLTASAASGIVAVNDGGTWGGVAELALPFP